MFLRIIAITALLLTLALPAFACRYRPVPFEESLKNAGIVFVGTVKSVEDNKITWTIEKAVRGIEADKEYVSDYTGSSCDIRFNAGDRWLFLGPDLPSGSLLLEDSRGNKMEDNLKALEKLDAK